MRFSDSIRFIPRKERRAFHSRWEECRVLLSTTGPQRQFLLNLDAEGRLCADAWRDIHVLVRSDIASPTDLQKELTNVFRNYLLRGNHIPPPTPAPLGRAVTKDFYVELLRDQFGFSSEDELNQFLRDLLKRKATAESNRRQLRHQLLAKSGRIMWATFDILPDGAVSNGNPFTHMPEDADGIRAQLGLAPCDTGKDLLLFVYHLPAGRLAYFPTIAEAYAAGDWLWYFRPAEASEPYGRTMPWPETGYAPYPEVVHEAITGNNLVEKVKIARGRRARR